MATPIFTIPTGTVTYPREEASELIFGSDFAHSEYVIPMARFKFYTATGLESKACSIYIRLGGAFNTTLSNGYQEATGTFGSVTQGENRSATSIGEITKLIGSMFDSGGTALQSSIIKSLGAGAGFASSAGNSGKSQIEFLTRRAFNSFQQLIYQGPKFRAFQLPFNMKPTSYAEAKTMRDIIQTFRIASSPRASGSKGLAEADITKSKTEQDALDAAKKDKSEADKDLIDAGQLDLAGVNEATKSAPLTFGYPDMCKLELILYHSNGGEKLITPVFKSDFCMIENVVLDYGASNKMVFLSNPESVAAGDYFPSEINMTISLRESVLVTAEYASGQNGPGITIF
jgi:hypothetical protein